MVCGHIPTHLLTQVESWGAFYYNMWRRSVNLDEAASVEYACLAQGYPMFHKNGRNTMSFIQAPLLETYFMYVLGRSPTQ